MGKKRERGTATPNRARVWDNLPWKSIGAALETDDGAFKGIGEDQAVLYSLEEISGEEYILQKDRVGGAQVVSASQCLPASEQASLGVRDPSRGAEEAGLGEEVPQHRGGKLKKQRRNKESSREGPSTATSGDDQYHALGGDSVTQATKAQGEALATPEPVVSDAMWSSSAAGLAEVVTAACGPDADEGAPKKKKNTTKRRKKKKKKKKRGGSGDVAGAAVPGQPEGCGDGGLDQVMGIKGEAREKEEEEEAGGHRAGVLGHQQWDLSAEELAKMLPWTYLGVDLHPALLFHLHRQGFYHPTPIQKRVLPKALLSRKDIVGAAETGSGKTLAYGLPILNDVLFRAEARAEAEALGAITGVEGEKGERMGEGKRQKGGAVEPLQALVLCPTRELALQVCSHLKQVTRGTGLGSGC
ncbi:unnamed protein product [Discosporangium mesarthrocarpum]